MKKVVVSGSLKLQSSIIFWVNRLSKEYEVVNFPKPIPKDKMYVEYPNTHRTFYQSITESDILFVVNKADFGIDGYIGASTFAEIAFALAQRLVYGRDIKIIILEMPSKECYCYDEIMNWMNHGWIELYDDITFNLEEKIKDYIPYNQQESKDKKYFLKLINTFEDVLTRENEIAHFVSSAIVLNKERNKMLMVWHNIYKGWVYPGGHADGQENLYSVAIKEVQEETGIKAKIIKRNIFAIQALAVDGHIKNKKYISAHTHLDVLYLFEADEKDELAYREEESSDVKWVGIDEVMNLDMPSFCIPVMEKVLSVLKEKEIIK